MTRRALVTGVTGQDGGYLAEALLAQGWEVHGLVRDAVEPVTEGVTSQPGDLSDTDLFPRLLDEVAPDVLFHLAGMSSVARSWTEAASTADVTGAAVGRMLAAACEEPGRVRVVLASSAEVFGGASVSPQDESTPLAPSSPYGAAKAYALHLARVYRSAGNHVSAAILYNHESPRRPESFVTRKITRGAVAIAEGRAHELRLGNLEAVRDWGWAPDYVDAMIRMATAEEADDYVVATGVGHTVRDFVEAAFAAAGVADWEQHVVVDPKFFRPVDGVSLVGDPSRAEQRLGWRPTVDFRDVVARMVEADLGGS